MFVTEETSQLARGWLKAEASKNMSLMFFTEDTSQALMFSLNVEQPVNKPSMFVTRETSHHSIAPYVASAAAGSTHVAVRRPPRAARWPRAA